MPVGSHLDFDSSNGLYYWEIFFHAPLLIAQALNDAQRFDDARRWYEYVFDPTQRERYWRFLPFLAVDVDALVAGCRADLRALGTPPITGTLGAILDRDRADGAGLPAAARADGVREGLPGRPRRARRDGARADRLDAIRSRWRAAGVGGAGGACWSGSSMIGLLGRQYELMGDRESLLDAYRDDPFDPHAIAALRPAAYRRAVVMAYIDNLLDWGDMLFRQYTGESIDEARMLYIFAYDLLGERPYDARAAGAARRRPPTTRSTARATARAPASNGQTGTALVPLTPAGRCSRAPARCTPAWRTRTSTCRTTARSWSTGRASRTGCARSGRRWTSWASPGRCRCSSRPPTSWRWSRASPAGASLDQITAALAAPVPAYRFAFLHRRAQELTDRLKQLGGDLLGAFERRDAEELTLLQNRQEAAILALTRDDQGEPGRDRPGRA